MQPGYLRELLPDSAPNQPESLQQVFDGEFYQWLLFVFHDAVLQPFGILLCLNCFSLKENMFWIENIFCYIADLQAKILPGVTHWQSPNFFAYYPSNSSTAGFLGEMLSAGLNIVGFSWITSPAATELEMIVLDWLAKMLNLPDDFLSAGKGWNSIFARI